VILNPRRQKRRTEKISTARKVKTRKLGSRRMKSTGVSNIRRKKRKAIEACITYSLTNVIRVII
jgi:hypothetical protein